MASKKYNIVLTGATLDNTKMAAAHDSLAKVFGMSRAQARAVFAKAPLTVKRNLDYDTASRFVQAFRQAKIEVKLHPCEKEEQQAAPAGNTVKHEPAAPESSTGVPGAARNSSAPTVEIEATSAFGFLSIGIAENDTLRVDPATVVSSEPQIVISNRDTPLKQTARLNNLAMQEYTAESQSGEICLSPSLPGQVVRMRLNHQTLYFRRHAALAVSAQLAVAFQSASDQGDASSLGECFSAEGEGDLWLQACGSLLELELLHGYCFDPSRLVAWAGEVRLEAGPAHLTPFVSAVGDGVIWLQSQSDDSLLEWAQQFA